VTGLGDAKAGGERGGPDLGPDPHGAVQGGGFNGAAGSVLYLRHAVRVASQHTRMPDE
jgi:hypothetical protein